MSAREIIAQLISGAPFPSKRSLNRASDALDALEAAGYLILEPDESGSIDYEVIAGDGSFCASSTDLADARHYAVVYGQDHPVTIVEVRRRNLRSAG